MIESARPGARRESADKRPFLLEVYEVTGLWPDRHQSVWVYDPNAVALEYAAATKPSVGLSLYGPPASYSQAGLAGLNLRDGRPSWSRLTLTDVNDVPLAVAFVQEALRLKRRATTPVTPPPAP
jgi:hypothetical protein